MTQAEKQAHNQSVMRAVLGGHCPGAVQEQAEVEEWESRPAPNSAGTITDAAYYNEAMDFIIDQTKWANKFPRQCLDRIRRVCLAVKAGERLPFKGQKV